MCRNSAYRFMPIKNAPNIQYASRMDVGGAMDAPAANQPMQRRMGLFIDSHRTST